MTAVADDRVMVDLVILAAGVGGPGTAATAPGRPQPLTHSGACWASLGLAGPRWALLGLAGPRWARLHIALLGLERHLVGSY
jgi:hypothetical protein